MLAFDVQRTISRGIMVDSDDTDSNKIRRSRLSSGIVVGCSRIDDSVFIILVLLWWPLHSILPLRTNVGGWGSLARTFAFDHFTAW